MMELAAGTFSGLDEVGSTVVYRYFLLQDQSNCDLFSGVEYGAKVISDRGEAAAIRHITTERQRIDQLLECLCRQGVSPIHLRDVIDDWL